MVRVGFAVVYLGFGYGLVALWMAVSRVRDPAAEPPGQRAPDVVVAGLAIASVGALGLPAVSGFPEGTLSGWGALDPISTMTATVLAGVLVVYAAAPPAGGAARRGVVASLAGSASALFVGNLVIQAFTDRGTEPEWGLVAATAASLSAAGVALARLRSSA